MPGKTGANGNGGAAPPSRYGALGGAVDETRDPTAECDPAILGGAILGVVRSGDAILVGLTRDGGAVRIQLFEGEQRSSFYAAHWEELKTTLMQIIQLTT